MRHRYHEGQTEQAVCLTVATNAIVLWNTVYLGDVLEELRHGADIDDEAPAHVSPAMLDHIKPYGRFLL